MDTKQQLHITQTVNTLHLEGATIFFLLKEYGLEHANFKGFELRKKAAVENLLTALH